LAGCDGTPNEYDRSATVNTEPRSRLIYGLIVG
jgi:hypothetical protein